MTDRPGRGTATAAASSGRNTAAATAATGAEPVTGNYFVSAYPPFSYWTEEAVTAALAAARQPPSTAAAPAAAPGPAAAPPLGLYIHVPFCVQRCRYCYYLSYENRAAAMAPYCGAVARELAAWMERPALQRRAPAFVYFGGGTPSLLSARRIAAFLDDIRRAAPWPDGAEVSFECAPRTLTADKVAALRTAGVSRISLGVQQMDDEVLRRNERVHLVADVERAYGMLRAAGFPLVNIDLMVGLPGESESGFMASLERVVGMAPESITLYLTEVPPNTPLYRSIREGTQDPAELSWESKRQRLDGAFRQLAAHGYTRRSAYAAVRDPEAHRFVYQDLQYLGADLLGVGTSSFSYLGGVHHQNIVGLDPYMAAVAEGWPPVWRAHVLSAEERLVREFILQLKLGRVDLEALSRRHGAGACDRFRETLERHAARGWLSRDAGQVVLTADGLNRVDRVLRDHFLPAHRGSRYS